MRATVAAVVLAALSTAPGAGQVFRSVTDAVRVDVLVTDGRRPIGELTAADFELRDSGVLQTIAAVQISEIPFSMTLALDTSSSVEGQPLHDLEEAARAAIEAVRPDDRVVLVPFAYDIQRFGGWSLPGSVLGSTVPSLRAGGSTSLFDAAMAALIQRDPEPGRRNLIVLLSDGDDTSSWLPPEAALDLAQRTDVVVESVIGYSGPAPHQGGLTVPRALARRSGIRLTPKQPVLSSGEFLSEIALSTGGDFVSTRSGNLRQTFEHIVADFRSRYVLTYRPEKVSQTGWHPIQVRLKDRRGKVTARRGYER